MSQRTLWSSSYGKILSRMIFANLLRDVIRRNICIGCGTCVAVCPIGALVMQEEHPRLSGVCIRCGYCYYSCPLTTDEHFKGFKIEQKRIELKAFGKVREEPFGVYDVIYIVRNYSIDKVIAPILKYLLKNDIIDIVATYGSFSPVLSNMLSEPRPSILPNPILIRDPDQIEKASFLTIFSPPTALSIRAAVDEYYASFFQASFKPSICYLAPPPHIRAIWRMRFSWHSNSKVEEPINLLISVFNGNYYSISEFRKLISKRNIDFSKILSFKLLNNGIELTLKEGESIVFSHEELSEALHKGITEIRDFTGEYADISIGGINGLTFIIVRNGDYKGYVESAVKEVGIKLEKADEEALNLLRGLYQ